MSIQKGAKILADGEAVPKTPLTSIEKRIKRLKSRRSKSTIPVNDLPAWVELKETLTKHLRKKLTDESARNFIGCGRDGRLYIVPLKRYADWTMLVNAWKSEANVTPVPEYASLIKDIHSITFTDWKSYDQEKRH